MTWPDLTFFFLGIGILFLAAVCVAVVSYAVRKPGEVLGAAITVVAALILLNWLTD